MSAWTPTAALSSIELTSKATRGAASHLIRRSFVESQKAYFTSSGREVRCPVAVVLAASDTYCWKRGPSCFLKATVPLQIYSRITITLAFLSYLLAATAAYLSAANILCMAGRFTQRSHQALTASRLTMISPYPHAKSLWISGM